MVNYQKFAVRLITYFAIALMNFGLVFPAAAITQNFQINSTSGYRVETSFSYDETQGTGIISTQPEGETNMVDSFKVRFYDPKDKMIASYDNIVDGVVQGNYFEFHYDLQTQQLLGKVDLGGESAGEIYLKGDIDRELSLIMVEPTGEERTMENGKWTIDNDY